jgi:hypothetical protein
MTGLTWPDSMSSVSACRSCVFSEQMNVVSRWLVNGAEHPERALLARLHTGMHLPRAHGTSSDHRRPAGVKRLSAANFARARRLAGPHLR